VALRSSWTPPDPDELQDGELEEESNKVGGGKMKNGERILGIWHDSEDHVWFEDQWMVASWCDE
jgi:hypothetical protein